MELLDAGIDFQSLKAGEKVLSQALILNVTDYKENDLILQLLTPCEFSFSALARSAKKSKKRFSLSLSPGVELKGSFIVPRNIDRQVLWTIQEASLLENYFHHYNSYAQFQAAFFVLSLLKDLSYQVALKKITYTTACHTLAEIQQKKNKAELLSQIAFFVNALSVELGFSALDERYLAGGFVECSMESFEQMHGRWQKRTGTVWKNYLELF